MTKDEDFKLLKIQTCILRVNLHCDGCKNKVKKTLQRIEVDASFEDDEDLRFLRGKANQMGFLKQNQQQKQQESANNNPRNSKNKSQPTDGNGKKGQNLGGQKGNSVNLNEGKRVNELSSMTNGGIRGFEMPQNSGLAMAAAAGGGGGQHMMLTMNGVGYNQQQQEEYNHPAASMMMNLQNRQAMQQQMMMMNQRSPVMPPTIGHCYYNYNYNTAPYTYNEPPHGYYYTSDENTSSCSIM
ncbi:Heavy metal-associated domain, HMA [Cynara cardunculus var. scolymus]|uniref:Heavy metal-associated domain, HMA n=1 Tax=Cynara cardunculus var. scolymus TaxID=59895 RepID=A0A103XVI9_CYNCS|nr:Heavy metal-associated domain, HMA [Cynara cardunculus var. scolymus]